LIVSHYDTIKIQIGSSANNRNATLLILLLWPVLLLAVNQQNTIKRRAAILLIVCASAFSILLSASQTAQVALFLSTLVFTGALYLPRLTHGVIVGAWCIATLFAVPLASAPYELGLNRSEWVFRNARDRMDIWQYTARQVSKAPIFGAGIRSTRIISKELQSKAITEPGDATPLRRLGIHAHNHYLQIWFELGAVGAVLFMLLGLVLLWKIRALAQNIRPYATAGFTAACIVAAFGWGLWQTWLLAGYSLSAIFLIFAMEFAKRRS
jgi:O-antigen ligase